MKFSIRTVMIFTFVCALISRPASLIVCGLWHSLPDDFAVDLCEGFTLAVNTAVDTFCWAFLWSEYPAPMGTVSSGAGATGVLVGALGVMLTSCLMLVFTIIFFRFLILGRRAFSYRRWSDWRCSWSNRCGRKGVDPYKDFPYWCVTFCLDDREQCRRELYPVGFLRPGRRG